MRVRRSEFKIGKDNRMNDISHYKRREMIFHDADMTPHGFIVDEVGRPPCPWANVPGESEGDEGTQVACYSDEEEKL